VVVEHPIEIVVCQFRRCRPSGGCHDF
jgi:hypothetical protein